MRELLEGGDRRSQARSDVALARVRANPARVVELADLTSDEDWLVAMRSLDLLEKLAREHLAWVEPVKHVFIGELADSDKWETRLQIVRALPLFRWSAADRRRAVSILRRDANHPQSFVRAWAVDSLVRFAEANCTLMPDAMRALVALERSGKKALDARARHIRARIKAIPGRRK